MSENIKQDQAALAELQGQATMPEDVAALHKWEDEIDEKRAEAIKHLGSAPMSHIVEVNGAIVDAKQVEAVRAQGQDVAAHNTAGRQA